MDDLPASIDFEVMAFGGQATVCAAVPKQGRRSRERKSTFLLPRMLFHNVSDVAVGDELHLEFESIHPFVNANGRTGRLMSNFLLMGSGCEPVNIQAESRTRPISLPVADLMASGSIGYSECIQCAACCDACRKGALELRISQPGSEETAGRV